MTEKERNDYFYVCSLIEIRLPQSHWLSTYYNITLFLSVNIGRNYWFRGRYQMI